MDIVALIFRWLHIGPAIVLVGGTAFMLFVLLPAAKVLPDEEHMKLRAAIIKRWKGFVHTGVALFLISGFYNYIAIQAPLHKGDGLYHALMGIKMLTAMCVFALAEIMVGRSKLAEKLRQNSQKFLAINLALAVAILMLSGFLKTRDVPGRATPPGLPSNTVSTQR
jgi:uncharacterized membrane protein